MIYLRLYRTVTDLFKLLKGLIIRTERKRINMVLEVSNTLVGFTNHWGVNMSDWYYVAHYQKLVANEWETYAIRTVQPSFRTYDPLGIPVEEDGFQQHFPPGVKASITRFTLLEKLDAAYPRNPAAALHDGSQSQVWFPAGQPQQDHSIRKSTT